MSPDINPNHLSACAGYLVLVENSLCPEHLAEWNGDIIHVRPTAEAVIALAQIKVLNKAR